MSRVIYQVAGFFIIGFLSLPQAADSVEELLIRRKDLPGLGRVIPLAISPDGLFAIADTPTGNLSRLELISGSVNDLRCRVPKRHELIRVIPGSDCIAYVDSTLHSIIILDTKLAKQIDVIALPEESENVIYNFKVDKSSGRYPRVSKTSLRGVPATGIWISRSGETLAVGFYGNLILVDLVSKISSVVPSFLLGGRPSGVAFSNDDTAMVVCGGLGIRGVSVVDLTTNDRIFDIEGFSLHRKSIPHTEGTYYSAGPAECTRISWSPDDAVIGGIVHENTRRFLRFWDGTTGNSIAEWSRPSVIIDCLEMLPDARHCLACVSTIDPDTGTIVKKEVIQVELKTGRQIMTLEIPLAEFRSKGSGQGHIYFFNGTETAFVVSAGHD